jgi:glycosyltransferase involved in cell wall biosynthesis
VVLGFDGFGGREYMVPGTNCGVASCPDVTAAADAMIRVMRDDAFAKQLAAAGVQTASAYRYEHFRRRWVDALNKILPDVSSVHDARADTTGLGTHPT